jgi:hypothetical protein
MSNQTHLQRVNTDHSTRSRPMSYMAPRSAIPLTKSGSGANLLQPQPLSYAAAVKRSANRISTIYLPTSRADEDPAADPNALQRRSRPTLTSPTNPSLTAAEKRKSSSSTRRPTVKPLGRGMTLTEKENGELEIKITMSSSVLMESSLSDYVPETLPLTGDSNTPNAIGSVSYSGTGSIARLKTASRNSLQLLNSIKTTSSSSVNKQAVLYLNNYSSTTVTSLSKLFNPSIREKKT